MATTLQRADINDSTYHNNPYRKNPYYNPFLNNGYNRLLSPGEKSVYTQKDSGGNSIQLSSSENNTYLGLLKEHGADRADSYLDSIRRKNGIGSFNLDGTPYKTNPDKNPGYNPPAVPPAKNPPAVPPAKNPPAGGGSGGSGGSGGRFTDIAPGVSVKGSSSVSWGSGGSAGGTGTLPGGANPAVQPSVADAVQQKLREATDLANKNALDVYNSGKAELNANIENQLRELYIARMMADRALPVQMSAQGINGGAAESTIAGNRNQYQSNRNALYQDANAKLADLLKTYNTSVNSNEQNLAQQMANLKMQLAIMEAQAKYDKELARMRR